MDLFMHRMILIAVIFLCLGTVVSGDVVLLKSGARFEGTVLQDDANGVELQTGTGVLTFSRAQVQRVLYRRVPEPKEPVEPEPAGDPAPVDPEEPIRQAEPGKIHEWNLPTERVVEVLEILDAVRRGGAVPTEQFIGKLLGQGMDQFDVMFLVLAGQLSDPRKPTEGAPATYRLITRQREVLLDAITRLYSAETLKAWDRFLYEPTPDAIRVQAIQLLAYVGDAAALKRILSVLNSVDEDVLMTQAVYSAFVQAIARLLEKEPAGYSHIMDSWDHFSPVEFRIVIDSVRGSESPSALPLLVRLLGVSDETDGILLARIRRIGVTCSQATRMNALTTIRPLADEGPVGTRAAAIQVMGEFDDLASFDALVVLLSDEEARVVSAASAALQKITGAINGDTPASWTRWKDREQEWYEVDADAVLDALDSPQPGEVLNALRSLASHRFYRDALIPEIAPSIDHPSAQVRTATCATLLAHGSDAILPTLLLALEDDSEAVVQAAYNGLQKITGIRRIPDDPEAWKAYLQGRQ
jgi:HEAT repeat protein